MADTYQDIPQANDILSKSQGDIEKNFLYLARTLGTTQTFKAPGTGAGDHQFTVGGTDATQFEGRHRQVSLKSLTGGAQPTVTSIGDGTDSTIYSKNGKL